MIEYGPDLFEVELEDPYDFIIQYNEYLDQWIAINDYDEEDQIIIIENEEVKYKEDLKLFNNFTLTKENFEIIKNAYNDTKL